MKKENPPYPLQMSPALLDNGKASQSSDRAGWQGCAWHFTERSAAAGVSDRCHQRVQDCVFSRVTRGWMAWRIVARTLHVPPFWAHADRMNDSGLIQSHFSTHTRCAHTRGQTCIFARVHVQEHAVTLVPKHWQASFQPLTIFLPFVLTFFSFSHTHTPSHTHPI